MIFMYMVYSLTTEELFEVTIEGCAEWHLKPRPLNSVQMLTL